MCAHWLEAFGKSGEPLRLHCFADEAQNACAVLPLVLFFGKGVIEPVTLGLGRVNVGNPARLKQVRDFRAGKAVAGVSERLRNGL